MITPEIVALCTGLSPSADARSSGVPLSTIPQAKGQLPPPSRSFNPHTAAPVSSFAVQVWAPPRSLAATRGILSSPRGTQMFHFPRFPPGLSPGDGPCARRVAPFGVLRISGRQRLPQAFRRVAASFLGRHRQGIHPAPFFRTSLSSVVPLVVARPGIRHSALRCRPARASKGRILHHRCRSGPPHPPGRARFSATFPSQDIEICCSCSARG